MIIPFSMKLVLSEIRMSRIRISMSCAGAGPLAGTAAGGFAAGLDPQVVPDMLHAARTSELVNDCH